jgi:hypothetical protein
MSDSGSGTPQFGTAEYKPTGQDICAGCNAALSGNYYRVNGSLACEHCTQQIKAQSPQDSHSAFVRATLFGVGGAILGLILYSAFSILTGIIIGYVSLAVGWLVGTAIKKGSQGVGGRRYQIAAVALTYAAVSLSAIPIGISYYLKEGRSKAPQANASASSSGSADSSSTSPAPATSGQPQKSFGFAIAALLFAGLASPFLELQEGFSGIIGLVILFVGIQIAWKMTAAPPLEILGPFQARAPESQASASN